MWGKHLIKSWSSTQSVIALSSGEAEYYGIVKGASVGVGLQSVLKDFDVNVDLKVKSDASAAIAIASIASHDFHNILGACCSPCASSRLLHGESPGTDVLEGLAKSPER